MTTLPWPAGQTPYVTPDQLLGNTWPTGVQWSTMPPQPAPATSAQETNVIAMLCAAATQKAENIVNQVLRATSSTEELEGPDFRVTYEQYTGNGRVICSRWPILSVSAVSTSPNAVWPRQWTALPAGNFEPEFPVQALYGTSAPSGAGGGAQSVLFAPGYMNNLLGRKGWRVKVTYIAGWPHTCLTANALAGATTIDVDDCTGWGPASTGGQGAAGVVYDPLAGGQEGVTCKTASVTSGPGTLTLTTPLAYSHAAGIMVSAMPAGVIWATALLAGEAALTRGATATTVQNTTGRPGKAPANALEEQAHDLLQALKRTM